MNEKDKEIMRYKAENAKLKSESDKIAEEIKQPNDKTIQSSAENQEIERAKDYYLNKNVEIEQLIQQVMNGGPNEPPPMGAGESDASKKVEASAAAKSIMG